MTEHFLAKRLKENAMKNDNHGYKVYHKSGVTEFIPFTDIYNRFKYYNEIVKSYKNSVCIVCLDYSVDYFSLIISFFNNGIVPVLVRYDDNISSVREDMMTTIDTVNPYAVFTTAEESSLEYVKEKGVKIININNIPVCEDTFGEKDYSIVMLTSGTTKFPRGMCLDDESILKNALYISRVWKYSHESTNLSYLPFHHIFGFHTGFTLPVYSGCNCILVDPHILYKNGNTLFSIMEKEKVTNLSIVFASIEKEILYNDFKDLSIVRKIIIGGERLSVNAYKDVKDKFKKFNIDEKAIANMYGMTEIGFITAHNDEDDCEKIAHFGSTDFLSVGPVDDEFVRVRIIGENEDEILPENTYGKIGLSSKMLARRFFSRGINSEVKFHLIDGDYYYINGDVGFISNGQIFICDREDDVITYNSNKFLSQYIEYRLKDIAEKYNIAKMRFVNLPNTINTVICYLDCDTDVIDRAYSEIKDIVFKTFKIRLFDCCKTAVGRSGSLMKLSKNNILKVYYSNSVIDYDTVPYNDNTTDIGKATGTIIKENDKLFAKTNFGIIPICQKPNFINSPIEENGTYEFYISEGQAFHYLLSK